MNPSTSSTITIDEKTEDLEIDTDEKHDNECVLLLNSEVQKFKNFKEKRQDLQGIRGLAILSVIGFHFLPSSFPNGYLGVDQFFVLSGFLMCMLLKKSSNSSPISLIFEFYKRRMKRILPLYILIIPMILFALFNLFPDTAYGSNMDSARNALLFESNRAVTEEESYFAKFALAIDLFTHTWSLSVEVQFYLLIPFVFLLAKTCLSDEYHMYYYTLLGSFSYLFSTFFCSEMESFNFMFARVWQFMTGMIVFEISEIIKFKEETKNEKFPMDSNAQETQSNQENMWKFCLLLIIGMAVIIVYPHEIPAKILRPFFTITTGTLMIFSRNNSFLSFPLLTYIGDISYSLYLLHWPIYAYWKLELSDGEIWNLELFEAILASFLLAILSYELYEKWYLKLSERTIAILCLILFFVVYLVIRKDDIDECMYPPANSSRLDGLSDDIPTTFEEAARINRKYVLNEVRNMKPPTCIYETIQGPNGWCSHTGLDKENGKYKIMIIGNSWAPNHGQLIYQECGSKAKSILQGSIGGCDPLVAERYNLDFCIENIRYFEKRIEEEQPDYVFLLTRFIDAGEPFSPNVTKTENDSIYIKMKRQLKIYLKSIKYKIFVMNQIPQTRSDRQAEIVNALRNGTNLAKFDKSFIHRRPFYARQRYDKLIEECEKCIQIDYNPLFWNTTTHTWRFYDEKNCGISYLTPGNHLTFHGLELIRPIYRDICTGL